MRPVALRSALAGTVLSLTAALLAGVTTASTAGASAALVADEPMRIGSYNIRAGVAFNDFKDGVTAYKPHVDVFGMQEIGTNERNLWLRADQDWGYHTSQAVQQNPIVWRRDKFDAVGFHDYKIAEDRDVQGGPKDASWATGVRLIDRATGQQVSILNIHLVKGAVKGGLPVPGREALFKLYAEQVSGTVTALKAEQAVAANDAVYILGDFNVGYKADVKRKHKKLPYVKYTALGMRSMWKGSPYLNDSLGTHSDALIDQIWTTADSSDEHIYRDIEQSDHWPPVATYQLAKVPGYVAPTGSVGFDQGFSVTAVKEGTGKKHDPNLTFVLEGDTDHGYPHLAFSGVATDGVLYEDGSDYLVDFSELYDGTPGANLYVDFEGDTVDEALYEEFTIELVDPVDTDITAGMESVTGTIRDDD